MSFAGTATVSHYRPHARKRMVERQVTEDDVLHALNNFVHRQETPRDSVLYIGPGLSGAELKVWVYPDREDFSAPKVVKSVAWRDDDAQR